MPDYILTTFFEQEQTAIILCLLFVISLILLAGIGEPHETNPNKIRLKRLKKEKELLEAKIDSTYDVKEKNQLLSQLNEVNFQITFLELIIAQMEKKV